MGSAQSVCALIDGNGTLGVRTNGYTRDAQISRFLLQSSGIRDYKATVKYKVHEWNIAQRLQQSETWSGFKNGQQSSRNQISARPWMHRKYQQRFIADLNQCIA